MSVNKLVGRLVGVDGGLAKLGISVIALYLDENNNLVLELEEAKVFKTEKSDKKKRIHARDDLVRRLQEVGECFQKALNLPHVLAVGVEDISVNPKVFPALVIGQLYAVLGIIVEGTRSRGLPLLRENPQRIKKIIAGDAKASKEDVQAAVEQRLGIKDWKMAKGLINHASDACAAALVCLESDTVKLSLKLIRGLSP